MKLIWSARARADLDEVAGYIASDGPAAAQRQLIKFREAARSLLTLPALGRQVPEFESASIRERLIGNYRLVYRVEPGVIQVVASREGHRLLRPEDLE